MPDSPRYAVIDIGSNSVRMIVYQRGRLALPLFNEKASCGLGKDLGKTGHLNQKGVIEASLLLQRFAHLARMMHVKKMTVVGTAALRTAKNGKKFVADVRRKSGLRIQIISGVEEAKLSAKGVTAAFDSANGIMGDMGGGSMELVALDHGHIKQRISLQHGPLSLMDLGLSAKSLREKIARDFKPHGWLKNAGGNKSFFAVGGVFRAMARLHMEITGYPLHVVHHYTIPANNFVRFLRECQRRKWNKRALKIGISPTRIAAMPYAAAVLLRLFAIAKFRDICFTTYGLREGVAIVQQGQHHPTGHNSLMATCKALAMQSGRFGLNGDEVFDFLRPMTRTLLPRHNRLFHAACWISDMGWSDHPEERAKQIFHRILHAPLLAIDHHGRAFMALLCYSRYAGKADKVKEMAKILDRKEFQLAMRLGLALRFADTVCGGVPHILPKLKFTVSGKSMVLQTPKSMAVAGGDEVHKRLEHLADAFKMSPMIIQAGRA